MAIYIAIGGGEILFHSVDPLPILSADYQSSEAD
jgi:hypothetical protein